MLPFNENARTYLFSSCLRCSLIYSDKASQNDVVNNIASEYVYRTDRVSRSLPSPRDREHQRERERESPVSFHFAFSRLLNNVEGGHEWKKRSTIGQPLRRIAGLIAVVDGTAAPRNRPVSGPVTSTSEILFKPRCVPPARVHLRTDAVCEPSPHDLERD